MIEIRNLTKKFDKVTAVDNLSVNIESGGVVGLVGSNGGGKSTLLKQILHKNSVIQGGVSVSETGLCEVASGLVISYVGQNSSGLKGDITGFCREHNLDLSLFCTILRQLDFERTQFLKNMEEYSEGQKK